MSWMRVAVVLLLVAVCHGALTKIHYPREGGTQSWSGNTADGLFVTLEGIPSTGFRWVIWKPVAPDLVTLDATSRQDEPPDNFVFNFTVTGKDGDSGQIQFGYHKPWIKGVPPGQTAYLNVAIVGDREKKATQETKTEARLSDFGVV